MTVQSDQFDLSQPAENILSWIWDHVEGVFDTPGQATILIILLIVFILFLFQIKKDVRLWGQIKAWLSVSIGAVIMVVVLVYFSPLILPEPDPWALYRVLVLRSASFLMALCYLTGGILFVCSVLPEGIIRRIIEWPPGPTMVISTIIASLAFVLSYS